MPQIERVVVGVDLSDRSRDIARWVVERLSPGSEVVLAYVVEPPPLSVFYRGVLPSRERMMEDALVPAREKLAKLASSLGDRCKITTRERVGRPAEGIAAAASEVGADLIVIGRHGRHLRGWGELGSTAEELFHFAHVPVLLLDGLPDRVNRLLVPIDDSALAPLVLDWASYLAGLYGAKVIALHVLSQVLHGHLRLISTKEKTERAEASAKEAAREHLFGMLADAGFDMSAVTVDITLGHADQEILDAQESHKADAIVMGSHGPGELERAVIGSCASTVARHAESPVLVVLAPAR